MKKMKYAVAGAAMIAATTASAQGITPMEFEPQATMLAPKGVVTACGLGFDGFRQGPKGTDIEQVSGSIAIYTDGLSLVKAGHQEGEFKNGAVNIRLPGTRIAWIRIEGQEALVPSEDKIVPGEKAPFLLFPVTPQAAAGAIRAMLDGKTIWVGFSKNGVVRHIFSGRVKPDITVSDQVYKCFADWNPAQPRGKSP